MLSDYNKRYIKQHPVMGYTIVITWLLVLIPNVILLVLFGWLILLLDKPEIFGIFFEKVLYKIFGKEFDRFKGNHVG